MPSKLLTKKPGLAAVMTALCYLYLFLPFLLFAVGWLRWYIALPLVGLVLFCLWRMVRVPSDIWAPSFKGLEKKQKTAAIAKLAVALGVIFVWVLFSGIGGFSWQTEDHATRNVIFKMLVHQPWPVVDLDPPAQYFGGPVAMSYYFGFWLPAALVGKVFGLFMGNLAQVLWAVLGIALCYWLVLAATVKKVAVWPLVVFVFFGGMDWVASSVVQGGVVNVWSATPHLEQWANIFQFSSHSTQLYWVYNQAIPAWIATVLLYVQRGNKWLALVWGVTLLNSTFPMVGLLPLAIWFAVRNHLEKNGGRFSLPVFIKDVVSVENIAGVLVALVLTLFLTTNNQQNGLWLLFYMLGEWGGLWLGFVLCEFLLLAALLARYQWKNPLFYIVIGILLLVPWVQVGPGVDFCMRVSIPPLLVLCLMAIDALQKSFAQKSWPLFAGIALVLVLGGVSSQTEIVRSAAITTGAWSRGETVQNTDWHPMEVSWRDNFFGDIEGSFFYKYLMKPPPDGLVLRPGDE